MKHVFIDGYNATMCNQQTAGYSKEMQRDALIERARVCVKQLFGVCKTTIIFDARGQWQVNAEAVGGIRVLYAPDADTEIVNQCQRGGRNIVVVTDDKRLQARIAQDVGRHIDFRSTSVLFEAPSQHKKASDKVVSEDDTPYNARSITKELEALWLKDEEG